MYCFGFFFKSAATSDVLADEFPLVDHDLRHALQRVALDFLVLAVAQSHHSFLGAVVTHDGFVFTGEYVQAEVMN